MTVRADETPQKEVENYCDALLEEMERCSDEVAKNKRTKSGLPGAGDGCSGCSKIVACVRFWDGVASRVSRKGDITRDLYEEKLKEFRRVYSQAPKQGQLILTEALRIKISVKYLER
ncbi:hypothetical protein [Dehalogenimonas alkenigignens]|uniref:hypothetical protein n=1 Tax=Dehalogenimonas alkenigignens TaxID=1217799 RepID=UPI000D563AC1|nr:hypothetical protein [Dehalogenimonas alkenigignens]PVV83523.1 hypothetical protein DD509_06750 [Dehalogenimonas alkenigignens]